MKSFFRVAAVMGAATLASQASANFIVNGSFENPITGPAGTTFSFGQTIGAGWISNNDPVTVYRDGFVPPLLSLPCPTPSNGQQALCMYTSDTFTEIRQTVFLPTPGQYTLSFDLGAIVNRPAIINAFVGTPGNLGDIAFADFSNSAGGTFVSRSMTFNVNAAGSYDVVFFSSSLQGTALDNVVLVPAPAAAAFLGLGGLLAARRRR
ncbi:MAG: hypothetical protein U0570_05595 [Phycisphaerales bacterium]